MILATEGGPHNVRSGGRYRSPGAPRYSSRILGFLVARVGCPFVHTEAALLVRGGGVWLCKHQPVRDAWAPLFTSIAAAAPSYWPLALRERAQFPSVLSARGKRKARLVDGGDTGRSQCAQKALGNARSYAAADPRRQRGPVARARRTHAGAAACTRMRPQIHMPHSRL